ncbi:MAG: DegT/DnrJ/EryC1/StrS family aminotransferase [Clostridiales Family XIII bacterium]|jgi:dTDP-4-amino-4,6-dideoxygalactose transaminase|nr:DegT/DnrJ/EryC1/StrS family aminotransferase [Clostridiales Family XIII bacterium]
MSEVSGLNIPFFDLSRQHEALREAMGGALLDVLQSGAYVEGAAVRDFESGMSEYLGAEHIVSCGSGTAALELALRACGIGRGDEVITTAFSFFASAEAISAVGATPVFADILDDFTIDPAQIGARLTARTKAIMPVHIFGRPARMDDINQLAREQGVKVIEDACQAIGAQYKGKRCGTLGDIAAFSFYPTKNLGGIGDGGMVATGDGRLAVIVRAYKSHGGGKTGLEAARLLGMDVGGELAGQCEATALYDPYKYFNYLIADNSRLDSIQAAALNVKLPLLDGYNSRRRAIAERYSQELAPTPLALPAGDSAGSVSCWHQYAVLAEDRDGLAEHLGEKGIGTGAFYPVPLHLQKAFSFLGYSEGCLPAAEAACARSVCLPIFPELTDDEQAYIIDAIRSYYR